MHFFLNDIFKVMEPLGDWALLVREITKGGLLATTTPGSSPGLTAALCGAM